MLKNHTKCGKFMPPICDGWFLTYYWLKKMKIAYLGPLTFTDDVFERYIKKDSESYALLACKSIDNIVYAVKQGFADIGIVPLENRVIGRINGSNIDGLQLIKKIKMPIRMALGGLESKTIVKDISLSLSTQRQNGGNINIVEYNIKYLISKKEAIAQCSRYINKNWLIPIDAESTAKGIEMLLNYRMNDSAVLCSERALRMNGLRIYETDISNIKPNWTIFGIIKNEN